MSQPDGHCRANVERSDLAQLASMCVGGDNCGSLSDSEARAHTRFKVNCSSELIARTSNSRGPYFNQAINHSSQVRAAQGEELGDNLEVEGKDGYVA